MTLNNAYKGDFKMNKNDTTLIIHERNYIYPLNLGDRYNIHIDKKQFPMLAQIQGSIQMQASQLLLAKACWDMGRDEKYYSKIRNYLSTQKSETLYIQEYQQLQQLLVQTVVGGTDILQAELKSLNKYINSTVYGFIYKKNQVIGLDSNVFADYFLKRVKVVVLPNQVIGIYSINGTYEILTDFILWRIISYLLEEIKSNVWRSRWSTEAICAVKTKCKLLTEFNTATQFINVRNGLFNLTNFALEKHSHKVYSTIQIPWEYDTEADCPLFKKFIHETTKGDTELIAVIQEVMGYCLTTETKAEKVIFFYGRGSNGKSVLANIITKMVGSKYVANTPLSELNGTFGLSTILDKLVCISGENEVTTALNTERLKQIASGDRINVNIKCKQQVDYRPICTIIALTNNLPQVNDESHGFFRKALIIPFLNIVTKEQQDKDLIHKLEEELPGILRWSIEGLKRLVENEYNFTDSKVVQDTMRKYKEQQKPMNEFIKDCVVPMSGNRVTRKEIKEVFEKWCVQNSNDEALNKYKKAFWQPFKDALEELGVHSPSVKIKGVEYFKDIILVNTTGGDGGSKTDLVFGLNH